MAIEFKGGGTDDAGPTGVVARFMLATATGDTAAAMEMLAEECRKGTELHENPMEGAVVTFGEVKTEAELFLVPTRTEMEGVSDETEFVVIEEAGELRLDLDQTMAREMGIDPKELLEQMGESMAEGMGQMMEGVADAMGSAISGLAGEPDPSEDDDDDDDDDDGPGGDELPGRVWTLAEGEFAPEEIMDAAYGICEHFAPDFAPVTEECESEEWADGGTKSITKRFGTADEGFAFTQTKTEREDFASVVFSVSAYGIGEGQEFSVVWAKSQFPEQDPKIDIRVMGRGPREQLASLGAAIEGNCKVLNASDC
jgi:hypothetical protein